VAQRIVAHLPPFCEFIGLLSHGLSHGLMELCLGCERLVVAKILEAGPSADQPPQQRAIINHRNSISWFSMIRDDKSYRRLNFLYLYPYRNGVAFVIASPLSVARFSRTSVLSFVSTKVMLTVITRKEKKVMVKNSCRV
jgi:hypothetical protein